MDGILKDQDFCFAYIDDSLVFSRSPQEHDRHLRTLFTQLQKFGILLNPSKCVFRFPEISFLGYNIPSVGSQPLPDRVADLQACPPPKAVSQLRRFLGMLNFYRRFLLRAASNQSPLHEVLSARKIKGSHPVTWTDTLIKPLMSVRRTCLKLLSWFTQIQPLLSPWSQTLQPSPWVPSSKKKQRVQDFWAAPRLLLQEAGLGQTKVQRL